MIAKAERHQPFTNTRSKGSNLRKASSAVVGGIANPRELIAAVIARPRSHPAWESAIAASPD